MAIEERINEHDEVLISIGATDEEYKLCVTINHEEVPEDGEPRKADRLDSTAGVNNAGKRIEFSAAMPTPSFGEGVRFLAVCAFAGAAWVALLGFIFTWLPRILRILL